MFERKLTLKGKRKREEIRELELKQIEQRREELREEERLLYLQNEGSHLSQAEKRCKTAMLLDEDQRRKKIREEECPSKKSSEALEMLSAQVQR